MYKFFMFAWVPIAVLAGAMLAKTRKIVIVTVSFALCLDFGKCNYL